jgi:hypothetical protein
VHGKGEKMSAMISSPAQAEAVQEVNESKYPAFDAAEFIQQARQRAGPQLSQAPDTGIGLEHLLRITRALIWTNQEIWERCTKTRTIVEVGILTFSWVSITHLSIEGDAAKLHFTVTPEVTTKDFGTPPKIPRELSQILFVPDPSRDGDTKEFPGFPDYLLYLEKAVLLHEVVLFPFLMKLKEHLESVHVFLGKIETWLLDPLWHAQFIENLFGKKVLVPDISEFLMNCSGRHCLVQHSMLSLCMNYNQTFGSHHRDAYTNRITHLCNCTGYGSFKVPCHSPDVVQILVSNP